MLVLHLAPIFKLKGIEKPFSYLVQHGFTYHAANLLINSNTRSLRMDHVERLCEIFLCQPNDLLVWVPDANKTYPENLPLRQLRARQTLDLRETLSKTPLSELRTVSEELIKSTQQSQS